MRVLGKIGAIAVNYQQQKSREDGSTYWLERYNIFIECGDDLFMTDSDWLHCQSKGGGLEIMKRRGIEEGAQGNAVIRFGFRDYNGKRYHEINLERFESLTKKEETAPAPAQEQVPMQNPEPTPSQKLSSESDDVQSEEGKDTDLPF